MDKVESNCFGCGGVLEDLLWLKRYCSVSCIPVKLLVILPREVQKAGQLRERRRVRRRREPNRKGGGMKGAVCYWMSFGLTYVPVSTMYFYFKDMMGSEVVTWNYLACAGIGLAHFKLVRYLMKNSVSLSEDLIRKEREDEV